MDRGREGGREGGRVQGTLYCSLAAKDSLTSTRVLGGKEEALEV